MLHEFVTLHRDAIILRTKDRLLARGTPVASDELDHGVPAFLTQLSETLRLEASTTPFASNAIGSTAAQHGAELRALGFSVSQVVHDYGDICQAITELAIEQRAPLTTEEFHTLNRCLDTAIAEAVTEHARMTAPTMPPAATERLGQTAHELRDGLNTALLAFNALKRGTVAINGSTGAVLGRSLLRLRHVIDRTLVEVRLSAGQQWREPTRVLSFLRELEQAGRLHAEYHGIEFTVEPVDPTLTVDADQQLLASAIMNLMQNAFKCTRPGGHVRLRARGDEARVLIEVEDECGGLPENTADPFQPFGERRGRDRTGLGLGLSIARKALRAHGGEIHIRNLPGKGCMFVAEIPVGVLLPRPPDVIA
jgi:signal transduction histidine kinase